jgi:hypothetical protein
VTFFDLLLIFVALATCLRLLIYRRYKATFKADFSITAYLLIVCYGALSLSLLTGLTSSAQLPYSLILVTATLSAAVFYCSGNVSMLIKLPGRIQHAINFRG